MSDGPFRSLPLRPHWKKFAERIETPSFSPDEVAEALRCAVMTDFKEAQAPLSRVLDIFLDDGQISFLQRDCSDLLEQVRGTCRGLSAGHMFIDCSIEVNANGLTGDIAVKTALTNAIEAHVCGHFRSIEEHYQRKELRSVGYVRDRLRAVYGQVSSAALASEILSGSADSAGKFRLTKRTGIDEGPLL